jgi:carbamoyltransferase
MYTLGISAYYHDSAAALLKDGAIIAAAQEERFTRKKHDPNFPKKAIEYCLSEAGITLNEVDNICYSEKPFLKFERLLETYLAEAPFGLRSFLHSMPIWIKEKLFLKKILLKELSSMLRNSSQQADAKDEKNIIQNLKPKLLFSEHHQSHAASAFYPSPFKEAAILTIDGVGEWTTTSIAHGKTHKIKFLEEIHFPHSLGLLYSAFTYYLGFKVNSGEYKVMGLAPYGKAKYTNLIKEHLIDIKEDGSFKMNMKYFDYCRGLTMTNKHFEKLFNLKRRTPETDLEQVHMDIAKSLQEVSEEIIIKLAQYAQKITGAQNLCLAGGAALNCVANGKILQEKIFKNIWIQPAAGDAGGALGAAYCGYYFSTNNKKDNLTPPSKGDTPLSSREKNIDSMQGAYLGPKFSNKDAEEYLNFVNAKYKKHQSEAELLDTISQYLSEGKVIGWHQGKMEFGPRALGNRSILGDPRNEDMQSKMNLKIKYRESFRPFAPSVLKEKVHKYFNIDEESPYMLLTTQINSSIIIPAKVGTNSNNTSFIEQLKIPRSKIPAVTHVDCSARVQTVDKNTNPRYYKLIEKFEEKTGCPVLINTSFNVRGEPIVCSPKDSYTCFMRTEMDVLVIEDLVLLKSEQPSFEDGKNWKSEFELD